MNISIERASAILSECLVGEFILRFSAGDAWELLLSNDLWLVAHEIGSPDVGQLNSRLRGFEPNLLDGVDPGHVAIATLLASALRRPITAVQLSEEARVSLFFGPNRRLDLRTDAEVVDWQWSLGRSPENPYVSDFTVACLWRGEVEVPGRDPHPA
jgi:hypothetical protein